MMNGVGRKRGEASVAYLPSADLVIKKHKIAAEGGSKRQSGELSSDTHVTAEVADFGTKAGTGNTSCQSTRSLPRSHSKE